MRTRTSVAAILLLALPWASSAQPDNRPFAHSYALVVGIDNYLDPVWPPLSYAVKDARGVADYLAEQGFEVIALYDADATKEAIERVIEDEIAPRLTADDRIVIFFAGHGATRSLHGSDRGYLVPADASSNFSSLIPVDRLHYMSSLMDIAKHQLIILDSCFGGLAATRSTVTAINPNTMNYLYEITRRKARQLLTAGGADQRVQDGGWEGHSKFTGQLLRALREGIGDTNGDGYITFSELSGYIQRAASDYNQTPGVAFLAGHEQGDFVFVNPQIRASLTNDDATSVERAYEYLVAGKRAFLAEDYASAYRELSAAAEMGNAEAMLILANMLWRGRGQPADSDKAMEWMLKAAERGNVDAMRNLVAIYKGDPKFADPTALEYWDAQLREAEALVANLVLVDPSGQTGAREPEIPEEDRILPPLPPVLLTVQ